MNIEQITNAKDLLNYIREEAKENGNLSIRGVAKLAGVQDTSIIRGAVVTSQKLAEKLAQHGFEGAALSNNGFSPKAVILVLEYYAYEAKNQTDQARQLIKTFSVIGLMETLEQLKPKTEEVDLNKINQILNIVINQQETINYVKSQNELLLAEKSEKEKMGELIATKFEGLSELLKGVLGEIALKYGEDINNMYKETYYYPLIDIANKFFPSEYAKQIKDKAACNINGLYKSMTKQILPKEKGFYVFDKTTVVFALWRLHHCANELGLACKFIDLSNSDYINTLENLFDIDS